jgi:hypothetical protein
MQGNKVKVNSTCTKRSNTICNRMFVYTINKPEGKRIKMSKNAVDWGAHVYSYIYVNSYKIYSFLTKVLSSMCVK